MHMQSSSLPNHLRQRAQRRYSSVAPSPVAIAPSRQRHGVAGVRAALRHRRVAYIGRYRCIGLAFLHPAHPSVALGSHSKCIISMSTPEPKNRQVVVRPVPFWARWKNSSGLGVLARRKGVLGVVLPALYDDGASHTRIQCSEILAFWPPPTVQAMLVR